MDGTSFQQLASVVLSGEYYGRRHINLVQGKAITLASVGGEVDMVGNRDLRGQESDK
jgi:hypothetical protein